MQSFMNIMLCFGSMSLNIVRNHNVCDPIIHIQLKTLLVSLAPQLFFGCVSDLLSNLVIGSLIMVCHNSVKNAAYIILPMFGSVIIINI